MSEFLSEKRLSRLQSVSSLRVCRFVGGRILLRTTHRDRKEDSTVNSPTGSLNIAHLTSAEDGRQETVVAAFPETRK